MIPGNLDSVLRDLRRNRDVTQRVKDVFKLPAAELSKAQRLEFTKAVISATADQRSEHCHHAFLEAIESLRDLAPCLKSKGQSLLQTTVSIEKYSVNHASALCFDEPALPQKLVSSADRLVEKTLKTILEARGPKKRPRGPAKRQIKRVHSLGKENEDPVFANHDPAELGETLELLLYKGASDFQVADFLPQRDSATIAVVVCGALAVRLMTSSTEVKLSHLLAFIQQVAAPWIQYLGSVSGDANGSYYRNYVVYAKRIQKALLSACHSESKEICLVLRARAYALTIGPVKLNQYARDLLRSVHSLTRAKKSEKSAVSNIWDVVGSVYDDAIEFVSQIPFSDKRWFSEDVAAWMDHIADVWSRRSPKPAPQLFSERIDALEKTGHQNELLDIYKFQLNLVRVSAYDPNCFFKVGREGKEIQKAVSSVLQEYLPKFRIPDPPSVQGTFSPPKHSKNSQDAERIALLRLRLLRTLEPLRKHVVSTSDEPLQNRAVAQKLLEVYVNALHDGICQLTAEFEEDDTERKVSRSEILTRLQKMIYAGLESLKVLFQFSMETKNKAHVFSTLRSAHYVLCLEEETSAQSGQGLRTWFARFILSSLQALFREKASDKFEFERCILFVAHVAVNSARIIVPMGNAMSYTEHLGFLEVARASYVSMKDWVSAADLSLQMLATLIRMDSADPQDETSERTESASLRFAHDLSNAMEHDAESIMFDAEVSLTLALTALLQHSSWLKHHYSQHRGSYASQDPFLMSAQMRRCILNHLQDKSSLCALRQFHLLWVECSLSGTLRNVERRLGTSCVVKQAKCSGHETVDSMISSQPARKCSAVHFEITSCMTELIACVDEGNREPVETHLVHLQKLMKRSRQVLEDSELLHLMSEVLEWLGSVLVMDECFDTAHVVFDLARVCRKNAGMPQQSTSMIAICEELYNDVSRCRGSKTVEESLNARDAFDDSEDPRKSSHVITAGVFCSSNGEGAISLGTANKHLKSALIAIRQSSEEVGVDSQPSWSVAGVNLNVSFRSKLQSGQAKLCDLFKLVRCLHTLALALFSAESLTDGRYYLERCADLSSFCLSDTNLYAQSLRSMSSSLSIPDNHAINDETNPTNWRLLEDDESLSSRNLGARIYYLRTLCSISLKELSANLTCPLHNSAGSELLELHRLWEAAFEECAQETSDERIPIWRKEFELSAATTHAFLGEHAVAVDFFKPLIRSKVVQRFNVHVVSLYFLARTFVQAAGSLGNFLQNCRTREETSSEPARMTRSRTRKQTRQKKIPKTSGTVAEVKELLDVAKEKIRNPLACPQLYRRVWNLSGMLEHDSQLIASALHRTVGCSFDIRWSVRESNLGRRSKVRSCKDHRSPSSTDSLNDALLNMSISSEGPESKTEFDELIRLLHAAKCVVVGLTTDETMSNLMVWRISGDGIVSKRITLPSHGETSVAGIIGRISDVMKAVKANAVKAGQEMTQREKQDWWKYRYSLDEEMQNILDDVESQWLGEVKWLLLPFGHAPLESGEVDNPETVMKLAKSMFSGVIREAGEAPAPKGAANESPSKEFEDIGQLVLLLDTRLERIPWESLGVLRELQISVTRAPSLTFLKHHLKKAQLQVDPSSLFYVINPAGDLLRTEETFKDLLDDSDWNGVFGKTSKEEVSSNYEGEQIYLYCGHGAGDQFLSPRRFSKRGEAPIALLMGCSSGRPDNVDMGDCESNGAAIDYLINGSRAVVANLWDVSDKDIDRFTASVLSRWLGLPNGAPDEHLKSGNLAEAVAASRSTCRLPYLVGSAAVVMGVPNISITE